MTRLCDLDWQKGKDPHWGWCMATLPGGAKIYQAKPKHPTMAGLYQIGLNEAPFYSPPSGLCWDALTTQCWLAEYLRWWEENHG